MAKRWNYVEKISCEDLALIKYFASLKVPWVLICIPLFGAYAYLKFQKSYAKLLKSRQFFGYNYYSLYNKLGLFSVFTIFGFALPIEWYLESAQLISFENSAVPNNIIILFRIVAATILHFIYYPIVIWYHRKQMWSKCVTFYQVNESQLAQIDDYQIIFNNQLILNNFLVHFPKIASSSFITSAQITAHEKLVLLRKKDFRIYATAGEAVLQQIANLPKAVDVNKLYTWQINRVLQTSALAYFGLLTLINQLNPYLPTKKVHKLLLISAIKAVLSYCLSVAIIYLAIAAAIGFLLDDWFGFLTAGFQFLIRVVFFLMFGGVWLLWAITNWLWIRLWNMKTKRIYQMKPLVADPNNVVSLQINKNNLTTPPSGKVLR